MDEACEDLGKWCDLTVNSLKELILFWFEVLARAFGRRLDGLSGPYIKKGLEAWNAMRTIEAQEGLGRSDKCGLHQHPRWLERVRGILRWTM